MRLFGMECRKIAGNALYWVLVLALLAVTLSQYEPSVESELRRADDPASVFYIASDGKYASERSSVPDEAMEHAMMMGATKLLIYNYRDNCYPYYPFGHVKEKAMSEEKQAVILQYLMELTGLSEQELQGTTHETADGTGRANIADVPISGGGAFILEPGKGGTNENGQFVAEPEYWQYVPGDGVAPEVPETPGGDAKNNPTSGSNGTASSEALENSNGNIEDIEISGGGAFILQPGKGGINENGQFVTEPEDWQYVPGDGVALEVPETPGGDAKDTSVSGSGGTAEKESESENGTIGDIPISNGGTSPEMSETPGGDAENDPASGSNGTTAKESETENGTTSDMISGGGAKDASISGSNGATPNKMSDSFQIQVSFERFQEIMEDVNRMIGRNSYFSWTMLKLYYFGNDMEDAPVTERQHREFYEGDRVTGAFARYYCDNISLSVLFLPAFVIVDLMLRDKRRKMQGLAYPRTISSAKLICTRYAAAVCMTMLPVLILPVSSLLVLMRYCGSIGVQADALAFVKYTLAWILPTVLLIMAISLAVTALMENYTAILLTGLLWLFGKPTVDKLEGGNYGLFDLIIRHNTLKGYGRMMENMQMLAANRIVISIAALALVGVAVLVYSKKRKGGLTFGHQKSAHHHRFKPAA